MIRRSASASPARREMSGGADAVGDVDDAPPAVQPLPIRPPVARAAAVVHGRDGKAAAGPVLHLGIQRRTVHRGRPAMTDHDQRRPFGRRRREITIAGRIVERVRRQAIRGRKLERLGDREIAGIDRQRRPDANGFHRPGRQCDPYHRVGGPPRAADEHRMRGGGHQVVRRLHIDVDVDQRARAGSRLASRHVPSSRYAVISRRFVGERPRRRPEDPLRTAELRRHRVDGFHPSVAETIEIPPTGAIRHEVQRAVGRPPGLEDRLAAAAGRQCRRPDPAVRADVRGPQLGAVPGHVGMAPRQPRQTRAVGTEARARIEIVTRGDHRDRRRRTVQRQADQRVDRLAIRYGVIFPHADQPPARGVGGVVRVAEPAGRQ